MAKKNETNLTVLVVENDMDDYALLELYLTRKKHHIVNAIDTVSALNLLETLSNEIDLILTDLCMPPGQDGLALAKSIRAKGLQTPIWLLSDHLSPEVHVKAKQIGIEKVIPKSNMIRELRVAGLV